MVSYRYSYSTTDNAGRPAHAMEMARCRGRKVTVYEVEAAAVGRGS